jgi:hypothetical protein
MNRLVEAWKLVEGRSHRDGGFKEGYKNAQDLLRAALPNAV